MIVGVPGRFYRLRCDLGLTQKAFADRFGLSYGLVRDLEQGRYAPSRSVLVLLAAIEQDPAAVERAASSLWVNCGGAA